MSNPDWLKEEKTLNDMKDKSIEYLEMAELIFNKQRKYEIAMGYKHCIEMVNHVHELVLINAKLLSDSVTKEE